MNIQIPPQPQKKKKSPDVWTLATIIACVVIPILGGEMGIGSLSETQLAVICIAMILVIAGVLALIIYVKKQKTAGMKSAEAGSAPESSGVKEARAELKSLNAKELFRRQETVEPVIVRMSKDTLYDSAAGAERDRLRRQTQLESFLKNGIIDKKEYALMTARYEREYKAL